MGRLNLKYKLDFSHFIYVNYVVISKISQDRLCRVPSFSANFRYHFHLLGTQSGYFPCYDPQHRLGPSEW